MVFNQLVKYTSIKSRNIKNFGNRNKHLKIYILYTASILLLGADEWLNSRLCGTTWTKRKKIATLSSLTLGFICYFCVFVYFWLKLAAVLCPLKQCQHRERSISQPYRLLKQNKLRAKFMTTSLCGIISVNTLTHF